MSAPNEEPESPSLDSPPLTSPDSIGDGSVASISPSISPPAPAPISRPACITPAMTTSSTPLGPTASARGPQGSSVASARGAPAQMNPDIVAKMKAFSMNRQGPAPNRGGPVPNRGGPATPLSPPMASPGPAVPGFPAGFRLPPQMNRPGGPQNTNSSPAVPGAQGPAKPMSLAEKRGMKLPGGLPGQAPSPNPAAPGAPSGRKRPNMTLSQMGGGEASGSTNGAQPPAPPREQTQMERYAKYVDTEKGALMLEGATVHGDGIDFSSGRSFSISLDEVDTLDELGKGNYGTVYKVRHTRPKFRRQGQGLAGNKVRGPTEEAAESSPTQAGSTGLIMAMKEMRLELEDAKFKSIITELDILHRCISPFIVDFYGAFFQEGAVYICMEFMDGGSVDKLYGDGVPENVLRKITVATTMGLKSLKEEHNIIHRDVKPTNILMNTRGNVKICDFGVSGNLVASIAKTNIGCQSYMAPERISGGGVSQAGADPTAGTYSVQSDIWSLGLTIIESALGRYPYPPETYDNIFSQLSAIVDGDPPDLPEDKFSTAARDFVAGCLNKIPNLRPTYPMLLQHAWLAPLVKPATIMEEDEEADVAAAVAAGTTVNEARATNDADFHDREVGEWVIEMIERRKKGVLGQGPKPALHAAPLDQVKGGKKEAVRPVVV